MLLTYFEYSYVEFLDVLFFSPPSIRYDSSIYLFVGFIFKLKAKIKLILKINLPFFFENKYWNNSKVNGNITTQTTQPTIIPHPTVPKLAVCIKVPRNNAITWIFDRLAHEKLSLYV